MSALSDEIIEARKSRAIVYEAYLKRIAELAKRVGMGQAENTPQEVDTPVRRALYNNLDQDPELAMRIDAAVRHARPDAWPWR
jgi:type I restriction enzyme R subunit